MAKAKGSGIRDQASGGADGGVPAVMQAAASAPPPVAPVGRVKIEAVAVGVTAPMIEIVGHPLLGSIEGRLRGARRQRAARAIMDGIIANGQRCDRLYGVFEFLIDRAADEFERATGRTLGEPENR